MSAIIVAVDFSEPSHKALDAAVALAKDLKADLVLVHALTPLPPGSKAGHLDPVTKLRLESEVKQTEQIAAKWAKQVGKKVQAQTVVRIGKPADIVAEEAKRHKASWVVVGSHGRTGIKRAVLGSVAESIVKGSVVPVIVVPA